jgi:hypothetical protein
MWLAFAPPALHAATAAAPAVASRAGSAIVDDSATVVLDATPLMTWRTVTPKGRDNAIVGRTRVNVRLATTPWLGKAGKIYMVLPAETTGSAKVTWRGHGLFMDGQLMPGARTLIYSGLIREKRMEDVLDVQIEADGVRLRDTQQLRFHFEIDVE